MRSGTVPKDAPDTIQVVFTAQDEIKVTTSRTQMTRGGGDRDVRGILSTNTVQKSGNKMKLAVGVVLGVAAAVVRGILKLIATHLMTIYLYFRFAWHASSPFVASAVQHERTCRRRRGRY